VTFWHHFKEDLTGVKLGQQIQREHDFHSLHCVYNGIFKVIDCLLTFSHTLSWKDIWETSGDRVIMGFASNRTIERLISVFSQYFFTNLGYPSYAFRAFSNIFLQFWVCILYPSASYTQVHLIHTHIW